MAFTNSQHTVKRFDMEIQQLVDLALEMGRAVERQVSQAIAVFQTGDAGAAQAVIAGDQAINRWDMEIDKSCVRLLSRRQPMSTDLRLVMSLNKAVNDLERIGDEAKAIAERTLAIHERGACLPDYFPVKVEPLAMLASERMHLALDSLARLDVAQSWKLVHADTTDEIFETILRALSASAFDSKLTVETVIDAAIALKALKRVAERACNLAEYVIYIIEGRDVRHKL